MAQFAAEGIDLDVPPGWEARIVGRDNPARRAGTMGEVEVAAASRTGVAHVANFPLPPELGDFGGGAVDLMGRGHVLVSLFEFGPESVGQPLFAAGGLPRPRPADYDPATCRKSIPGQSAVQRFFTVAGRAFALYVVLGSHTRRVGLAGLADDVLAGVRISGR